MNEKQSGGLNISVRSFLMVVGLLVALLAVCGSLSLFIPQGAFERDAAGNILPGTYQMGQVQGIALWRVLTAPVRVFASEDALNHTATPAFLA